MTREEAIKVLEKVKRVAEIYESEDVKAYNMAIKALEQEPCEDVISGQAVLDATVKKKTAEALDMAIKALKQEPCEDAISRQAVLNTLDNMDKALDVDRTVENYKELLKECYEGLPFVTPQPKTGHWIDADGDNAICGCCNRLNHLYGTYCKHCGAKMQEVEENG